MSAAQQPAFLPPRPWTVHWVPEGYAYLVDADGKKIAAVWGPRATRVDLADFIATVVNQHDTSNSDAWGR